VKPITSANLNVRNRHNPSLCSNVSYVLVDMHHWRRLCRRCPCQAVLILLGLRLASISPRASSFRSSPAPFPLARRPRSSPRHPMIAHHRAFSFYCQFLYSNNVPPPTHTTAPDSMLPHSSLAYTSRRGKALAARNNIPSRHICIPHMHTDEFKNNLLHL
jgi:hypothetical protein